MYGILNLNFFGYNMAKNWWDKICLDGHFCDTIVLWMPSHPVFQDFHFQKY